MSSRVTMEQKRCPRRKRVQSGFMLCWFYGWARSWWMPLFDLILKSLFFWEIQHVLLPVECVLGFNSLYFADLTCSLRKGNAMALRVCYCSVASIPVHSNGPELQNTHFYTASATFWCFQHVRGGVRFIFDFPVWCLWNSVCPFCRGITLLGHGLVLW